MKNYTAQLAKLLDDESFVRWIKGEATSEEQKNWNRWLESDAGHKELAAQARALYLLPFSQTDISDTAQQRQELRQKLEQPKTVKISHIHLANARSRKHRWTSYAVAAGIALLIGIVYWLAASSSPHLTTVHTKYGMKDSLLIRDGSLIVLNANSTLQYNPKSIASKDTRIKLEGEAYFAIKHNPDRTLQIITKDGMVEDQGTAFNVNTRDNNTEVVLAEGRVKVIKNNDQVDTSQKSYAAQPGERVTFSVSRKDITVRTVNTEVYTSWVHNQLIFDKTPLHEIAKRIEATYGMDIRIEDPAFLDKTVSGSLGSSNLSILLKGLSQTLGLQVRQKGKKIIIAQK